MSGRGGPVSEEVAVPPADPAAEKMATIKPQDSDSTEEGSEITDEEEEGSEITDEEEEEDDEEEGLNEEDEEEEVTSSAHLEPTTLPWPGDIDKRPLTDDGDQAWSEKRVSESEERDTGISGGSQDLSEDAGSVRKGKWRESMPEGEKWRDDEMEVQRDDKGEGSLADDEDEGEEEEEEEEDDGDSNWISEKTSPDFTPRVTIVRPSSKEIPEESRLFIERDDREELQEEPESAGHYYPEWTEQDDKYYLCDDLCGEKLKVILTLVAAGIIFPLLVWGGYALLPFESPMLKSAPLRVVYTLRCSFFAIIPILLGVLVLGIARMRYSALQPLYKGNQVHKEVAVHWHYINESLALFLFFFLQLAVMATYISQDLVKLVPLLTIIFVFGRLIYWLCLSLGSTIRGLGFGLSFLPILVMLGVNLYYVCSSVGQGSVFDVEQPTMAPPPRQRFWG